MHIAIVFFFEHERHPAAVTEVEGAVTDILLPLVGDTVSHRDLEGNRFRAEVLERHFDYDLEEGEDVDGRVRVVLSLRRMEEARIH